MYSIFDVMMMAKNFKTKVYSTKIASYLKIPDELDVGLTTVG